MFVFLCFSVFALRFGGLLCEREYEEEDDCCEDFCFTAVSR